MESLIQRRAECSLCAIATLNGLSQKDYYALSKLAREAGAVYNTNSQNVLRKAIDTGIQVALGLGLYVPPEYPRAKAADGELDKFNFRGRGIVRIGYIRKRCRNWSIHVLTFEDDVFYESNGQSYAGWQTFLAKYKAAGSRDIRLLKIFR